MIDETPNLNYIKALADGDELFENQLLTIIKRELPEERENFVNSINQKKYEISANLVHKIKHKISILGLEKNVEFASDFENELKNGNPERKNSFLKLVQKMEKFLNQI